MNPTYFGDSYDIVKRFFCRELQVLGYSVSALPMFTGEWKGAQGEFLRFVGAKPIEPEAVGSGRSALFVDPDTGVHEKSSKKHVSLRELASHTKQYRLVFSFDQSFSRQHVAANAMREKLALLVEAGFSAMYYNSHARFLFVSAENLPLSELRGHFESLGMPASRFVTRDT
jgi:hypothetical protein